MNKRGIQIKEMFFTILSVAGLLGLPYWVLAYEGARGPDESRLIRLTGVMKDGVWTDESVTALNYGLKEFQAAEIHMDVGETVTLRLISADVTHGFYIPELEVGPVEVEPGHSKEVTVLADSTGVYTYYCTTVCGDCHHFMRGVIVVGDVEVGLSQDTLPPVLSCLHGESPSTGDSEFIQVGEILFDSRGCVACHGEDGRGGIRNPNYIKTFVPDLRSLADRMFLYTPDDADAVIKLLANGADLSVVAGDPPFRRFNRFLAQYNSVRSVIRDGKPAARLDEAGVEPPLHMPSWEAELTDREVDAVIAYLLTQYDWEGE